MPMTSRPLTPADPAELHAALSHALRYDRSGRRTQDRATIMADVAADHLIEALRLSGFVIMRGPPAPNHAGPDPEHSQLRR
jgi:hypothetical protein